MSMSIGKRLLVYSTCEAKASNLLSATSGWGCLITSCESSDDLRGKVEGGEFDMVLVEDSTVLRGLIEDAQPDGQVLEMPLSEIEKRHILRVLSSTKNNKTRAAKILGIDTKTLYNKLKSYGSATTVKRRANVAAASPPPARSAG